MKRYFKALTIAGSDSGGGAGIQADLKTFSALGCFGMSAVTAITAQNTVEVSSIHPIPPEMVRMQMEAVLTDIGTDAVKIGMLHSSEIIKTIYDVLLKFKVKNIVLDTVMSSKGGNKLLQNEAIDALKKYLIPISDIITPNLPEAEIMLGKKIETLDDMRMSVRLLGELGSKYVLLKGGHLNKQESADLLFNQASGKTEELKFNKINTMNSHGTGCTLSSAIAAFLAKGTPMEEAVVLAKSYIHLALEKGSYYQLGSGHGPVHHFHNLWKS
ncbi:MAG TPA: bifunctional hydroxymethylpyrimidine kinase/phosphomethylpyrimidine kinase [Cytophagales bacterium]|nr:bifunctional hydroxymethylpyrimidine kinase/phosphomethylpyrimidine kinase [Cytophagales bacterium]